MQREGFGLVIPCLTPQSLVCCAHKDIYVYIYIHELIYICEKLSFPFSIVCASQQVPSQMFY